MSLAIKHADLASIRLPMNAKSAPRDFTYTKALVSYLVRVHSSVTSLAVAVSSAIPRSKTVLNVLATSNALFVLPATIWDQMVTAFVRQGPSNIKEHVLPNVLPVSSVRISVARVEVVTLHAPNALL